MKAKFTRGPWRTHNANASIAIIGEEEAIAHIPSVYSFEHIVAKHNASLIAAAPELLQMLEETVAAYGKPGGPWNVPGDAGGWLARSCAVIEKAYGYPKKRR